MPAQTKMPKRALPKQKDWHLFGCNRFCEGFIPRGCAWATRCMNQKCDLWFHDTCIKKARAPVPTEGATDWWCPPCMAAYDLGLKEAPDDSASAEPNPTARGPGGAVQPALAHQGGARAPPGNNKGKKKTGPWICGEEDCGKVCVSESKLTKHMEAHSDVFPIACPTRSATHYCTKRYKSKQARDSHLTRNECNLFMDPIEVPQTQETLEDVVNDFEAAVGDVQPPAVTPAALPPAE